MAKKACQWLSVAAAIVGSASITQADEPVDATTKAAIQGVISRQLDAFARNDAKMAESFAAPGIQSRFPEPERFFAMVRQNYAVLLHPKSTQFGDVATSPHGPLQKMIVVAPDGSVWTAIYAFEQVDGTWRISGCGLRKAEGQQDI